MRFGHSIHNTDKNKASKKKEKGREIKGRRGKGKQWPIEADGGPPRPPKGRQGLQGSAFLTREMMRERERESERGPNEREEGKIATKGPFKGEDQMEGKAARLPPKGHQGPQMA